MDAWRMMSVARYIDRTGNLPDDLSENELNVARKMKRAIVDGHPADEATMEIIGLAGVEVAHD